MLCAKLYTMCEITHRVQSYTFRSSFALIVEKIPLSNFFYPSTATDASDKYQVWAQRTQSIDSFNLSYLSS